MGASSVTVSLAFRDLPPLPLINGGGVVNNNDDNNNNDNDNNGVDAAPARAHISVYVKESAASAFEYVGETEATSVATTAKKPETGAATNDAVLSSADFVSEIIVDIPNNVYTAMERQIRFCLFTASPSPSTPPTAGGAPDATAPMLLTGSAAVGSARALVTFICVPFRVVP
jgi:hypothetical protein